MSGSNHQGKYVPKAAPKACSKPGCPAYQTRAGRCDAHQRERKYVASNNRHIRGYGHKWEKLRAYVLMRDDGLCIPCKENGRLSQATEVDHITPKALGGDDDEDNLQSICSRCHKLKTRDDVRTIRERQRIDERGG